MQLVKALRSVAAAEEIHLRRFFSRRGYGAEHVSRTRSGHPPPAFDCTPLECQGMEERELTHGHLKKTTNKVERSHVRNSRGRTFETREVARSKLEGVTRSNLGDGQRFEAHISIVFFFVSE